MYLIVLNQGCVSRENYDDLQTRFDTAEMALADKQKKIDEMKMEIFQKEKELETISVFQAQVQTIVWIAGHPPIFLSSLQLPPLFIMMCFCVHIQAEIYSSDFYAERAAREKIHEEKEAFGKSAGVCEETAHPASGWDGVTREVRHKLQTLTHSHVTSVIWKGKFFMLHFRHSMSEMQRRHMSHGANPQGPASPHHPQGGRGPYHKESMLWTFVLDLKMHIGITNTSLFHRWLAAAEYSRTCLSQMWGSPTWPGLPADPHHGLHHLSLCHKPYQIPLYVN